MNFAELGSALDDLIAKKRFRNAVALLQKGIDSAPEDCLKAFCTYQLGSLYWSEIGDGVKARECFLRAIELWESSRIPCKKLLPEIPVLANSYENLMILSLSFEEYFRWGETLEKEAPEEEILHQQRPVVIQKQDRSLAWPEVMQHLTVPYFDPDPSQDAGRYACANSILHLMLAHRKALRLSQDQWRIAVERYANITILLAAACEKEMKRNSGRMDYSEFFIILATAIPFVEEYAKANPSDDKLKQTLATLQKMLAQAEASTPADEEDSPSDPPAPKTHEVFGVFLFFLALCIGLFYYASTLSMPWNILAGIPAVFFGLIATGALSHLLGLKPEKQTLRWCMSDDLAAAIRNCDLEGLSFQLVHAGPAVDGSLELRFKPISPLKESKIREAHLALRCVVGLTFPDVVATIPRHRILDGPATGYVVNLGAGVRIPAYFVENSVERLGPLQVTSEEAEDGLWVYVAPLMIAMNRPGGAAALADIAPGFAPLKNQPIVLDV